MTPVTFFISSTTKMIFQSSHRASNLEKVREKNFSSTYIYICTDYMIIYDHIDNGLGIRNLKSEIANMFKTNRNYFNFFYNFFIKFHHHHISMHISNKICLRQWWMKNNYEKKLTIPTPWQTSGFRRMHRLICICLNSAAEGNAKECMNGISCYKKRVMGTKYVSKFTKKNSSLNELNIIYQEKRMSEFFSFH